MNIMLVPRRLRLDENDFSPTAVWWVSGQYGIENITRFCQRRIEEAEETVKGGGGKEEKRKKEEMLSQGRNSRHEPGGRNY